MSSNLLRATAVACPQRRFGSSLIKLVCTRMEHNKLQRYRASNSLANYDDDDDDLSHL